jgi:hypothetical protein
MKLDAITIFGLTFISVILLALSVAMMHHA